MDAVPVVWVAPAGTTSGDRDPQYDRALEAWGQIHGEKPTAPAPAVVRDLPVDPALADAVEADLEKARDATSALDGDGAERALARAEAILREHPELPQGAWLMAEVERGWAARWARVTPKDPERAAASWRRARGLDGGREPGVGEEAVSTVDPEVGFTLRLDGPGEARKDGVIVAPGPLRATAGDHQITVARGGRLVWAGWAAVTEGGVVRLALPTVPACSAEAFARVRLEGGAVRADDVTCPRWLVASPAPRAGSVLVATCAESRCGALMEWRADDAIPGVAGGGERRATWPAWATWTLVGAGAVLAAGAAVAIDVAAHGGTGTPVFVDNGTRTTP